MKHKRPRMTKVVLAGGDKAPELKLHYRAIANKSPGAKPAM